MILICLACIATISRHVPDKCTNAENPENRVVAKQRFRLPL